MVFSEGRLCFRFQDYNQNINKMPIINNNSEGDRILRLKTKAIYADYLNQSICTPHYNIESGSGMTNSESTYIDIKKGAIITSCDDVNCIISHSCSEQSPSIVSTDLLLHFESGNTSSYPGSGTTWINIGTGGIAYNATIAGSAPGVGLPIFNSGTPSYFSFTRNALINGSSYTNYNRIYLPNPPGIQDDFTYCSWINTTETGYGQNHYQLMYIVSTETGGVNNDWGFGIDNNGKLAYGDGKTSGTDITIRTTESVNTGNWVFVSVTRTKSTGTVILYINGYPVKSGTCNIGNSLNTGTDIVIGSEKDFPGYTMGGKIASLLGNTSVLSSEQILQNYNATKSTYGY